MDAAAAQRAVGNIALGFTPRVALLDEAVLMDVTAACGFSADWPG